MFRLLSARRYVIPGALLAGLVAAGMLLLRWRKPVPAQVAVPQGILPLESSSPETVITAPLETITLSRTLLGRLCGVGALLAMLLSGWGFRWEQGQNFSIPYAGWNGLVVGAVLLGASIWFLKPQPALFSVLKGEKSPLSPHRIGWISSIAGIFALVLLALFNGHPDLRFSPFSQHVQMALFIGGVGAVTWGLGGFRLRELRALLQIDVPLLLLTLLALFLRVWGLNEFVHIMVDELHVYEAAWRLMEDPNLRILSPVDHLTPSPLILPYLQQISMRLFGPELFGGRLPVALIGALTIPAIYLLAKNLFDRKTGLLAAAVLAVFPAHIHLSRLTMVIVPDPLFGTLAAAFLVAGLQTRSRRAYALAGINLGLAMYFYEGGRLLYPALLLAWIGLIFLLNRPWRHIPGLLLFIATTALIYAPYFYTVMLTDYSLTPRFDMEGVRLYYLRQDIALDGPISALRQHWDEAQEDALYHTIYSPDGSQFYYGGYTAILPWYVVPFYLLGLFYLLWRCRGAGALLWVWLVAGLVGIGFLVSTDWTARFVVLFPAMALVVAVGLRYPLQMLWPSSASRRMLWGIITGLLLLMSAVQLSHYFGDHMTIYNRQLRSGLHDFAAVQERAGELASGALLVYLTDEYVFTPVVDNYIALRDTEMDYYIWTYEEATREKLIDLPLDRPLAFAILPMPAYRDKIRQLRELFPLEGPYFSRFESVPLDRQYELYIYKP